MTYYHNVVFSQSHLLTPQERRVERQQALAILQGVVENGSLDDLRGVLHDVLEIMKEDAQ